MPWRIPAPKPCLMTAGHAAALGIPLLGTVALVLKAKQRGAIPVARPVLETLRRAGMYLSDAVLTRALATVGE